jgi:predicted RecB family nuclease
MASRITDAVVEATQQCRLKAYFLLRGDEYIKSNYENLLIEQRDDIKLKAIINIHYQYRETDAATDLNLSVQNLRKGFQFILSARLENERHSVVFDGLRRINGPSALGDFRYEPVMFCPARRVHASDRQQLATRAVLLAQVQGALPGGGVIYLGHKSARTGIRFGPAVTQAENLLRDAERLQRAETPPRVLLNDHCRICAFRDRCRDQAIREDNLSLLRGMGEKTIKRHTRKGVLTLTQLAHTFRPRRHGKRAQAPPKMRDHALQALAIRDQMIYVLGAPKFPSSSVRIYLDIEAEPEEGFTYLIGLIVDDGERIERHSLWADDRKDESKIFNEFLDIVAGCNAPCLYCYGNYERTFIARMRKGARRKRGIDAVLAALTNVLTIIYPHYYFPTYSNGLKEVAGCLGCRWSEPDASGIESVVWRKNWEKTGNATWRAKLIQYNLEDCDALRRVCVFLSDAPDSEGRADITPRVASVSQLDNLARCATWSRFENGDFDFINKRAFFDYQRRHVFVRTKGARRRVNGKTQSRHWQNRDLRPTHRAEVTATHCPFCNSKQIVPLDPKRRISETPHPPFPA